MTVPGGSEPEGTIAVDTSALVAVVLNEADHERLLARLKRAPRAFISSVSVVEARMVIYGRLGAPGVVLLDRLLALPGFEVVAPDAEAARAAFEAFVTYGKGTGHPAGLNFGDVFSYALARQKDVPLLYKGADFSETDIAPARAPRDCTEDS